MAHFLTLKAMGVCLTLLGPDVQICNHHGSDYICDRGVCRTEKQMVAYWKSNPKAYQRFIYRLYGFNPKEGDEK
jgi:hypothetical protein